MGLRYLWFYVQELTKAQLAVVLVLKRLRRRVNGLNSHPTDWEKPGIEPATPGLQGLALIHYTTGASFKFSIDNYSKLINLLKLTIYKSNLLIEIYETLHRDTNHLA